MICLHELLDAEDVRAENLDIFEDTRSDYLRTGVYGMSDVLSVRQSIRNVRDARVRQMLRAVPAFDADGLPSAWSHWMAVACGRHLWPDANHRTALVVFDRAIDAGLGLSVDLDPQVATDMVLDSKRMRDAHRRETGVYYTVAELADFNHPYRVLFRSYESRLRVEPAV